MLKKGVIGTIAVILIIGVIGVVSAGFYFYEYFSFKTLKICVTEESVDSEMACSVQTDCLEEISEYKSTEEFEELPSFIKQKLDEGISKIITCDETCKVKEVYTNFYGEDIREFESCAEGEEEISIEIRGKEGLQLLTYLKNKRQ